MPNTSNKAKAPAQPKAIPKFADEAQERAFWEAQGTDATAFFDTRAMAPVTLKNLKPSTTSISLRLSDGLLAGIRREANKLDVPYQSLMKIWLTEKLAEHAAR